MKEKFSITIIIPVYNAEKTIRACVDSIINQTIKDWKLIIVDDGSTDKTSSIVDAYANKDERICVSHRENSGVSSSRNYAISKVDTEYFVCVDSDDSVYPNYLEEFMIAKSRYPNVKNIWSSFQIAKYQDDNNGEANIICENEIYSKYCKRDILKLYNYWMLQMPWHKLYRTAVVVNNEIKMDESLSLGEDLIFNLEYLDSTDNDEIVIINKVTYNYVRNNNDSLDHKYRDNLLEIYNILDKKMQYYIDKWNVTNKELFFNSRFYHYENIMNNTFHKDNKESIMSKIKFNNRILKSNGFKETYIKKTCEVNKYFDLAYKSENYIVILIIKFILKMRRKKK